MAEAGTLLVVSGAVHHDHGGRVASYTPYVREIDQWAELFDEVRIAAPVRRTPPGPDCAPFRTANVSLVPMPETGGTTWTAKLRQVALVPVLATRLVGAMRAADLVDPRCPGNLGLLAVVLRPLARRPTLTKYAGQWGAYDAEPWSYRLQRWLLRRPGWGDPVTVYGRAPSDPPHVVSFFSSAITDDQLARGAAVAAGRVWSARARVLFVGRLSEMKHVDAVVRAVAEVAADGLDVSLTVLGDGPELGSLTRLVTELGADAVVDLRGAVPFDDVLDAYADHDVLVLVSESEGFPKVIAEAMAHGLVAVGSDIGFVREMLGDGRGVLVAPGDARAVAAALRGLLADPAAGATMGERAAAWAGRYSVESLQAGLRELVQQALAGRS